MRMWNRLISTAIICAIVALCTALGMGTASGHVPYKCIDNPGTEIIAASAEHLASYKPVHAFLTMYASGGLGYEGDKRDIVERFFGDVSEFLMATFSLLDLYGDFVECAESEQSAPTPAQ